MATVIKLGFAHKYEVGNETEPDEYFDIEADSETDVRHWIVTHLNLSENWTIKKVA